MTPKRPQMDDVKFTEAMDGTFEVLGQDIGVSRGYAQGIIDGLTTPEVLMEAYRILKAIPRDTLVGWGPEKFGAMVLQLAVTTRLNDCLDAYEK